MTAWAKFLLSKEQDMLKFSQNKKVSLSTAVQNFNTGGILEF